MNAKILLQHFNRISDAPDALARLRRFILDLAVRGKLVDQLPTENAAPEPYQRARNAAEATLTRPRHRLRQQSESPPFEVPQSWQWATLSTIGFTQTGTTPPTSDTHLWGDFIPFITPGSLDGNSVDYGGRGLSESGIAHSRLIQGPSILMVCIGSSIGKVGVTDKAVCCNQQLTAVTPYLPELTSFIAYTLQSTYFQHLVRHAAGMGTLPIISKGKWELLPVPLPPPTEQNRIVSKVNELIGLCNRLEEAQKERERRRDRLTAASVQHLSGTTDGEEGVAHARFFINHVPTLTARPEQLKLIRQTILKLAVRGQLVRQDPKDEPAAIALIQRQLTVEQEQAPWKLPPGWAWSSLRLIGETLGGGTPSKANPDFWKGSIPWVSPKDMKVDLLGDAADHISELAVAHSATKIIPQGSLLIVVRGMILAHSFPAAITTVPVTINQDMKAIVPFRPEVMQMLLLLMKGLKQEILRLVLRSTHGTCKLLTDDLFSMPIPIPPVAEQRRIVAKVDELMSLCNRLESQLTTQQADSHRLLEAVLFEALVV